MRDEWDGTSEKQPRPFGTGRGTARDGPPGATGGDQ